MPSQTQVDQNGDVVLPGLDCGLCGSRTCEAFRARLVESPEMIRRCVHLARQHEGRGPKIETHVAATLAGQGVSCTPSGCAGCRGVAGEAVAPAASSPGTWQDSLGREFDFYLEHFPEEPGPREIILPHNPLITRELRVEKGDTLIGRPLGMSCGCPVTHCGIVTEVDPRTGVIVWCVTGPLGPRQHGYKDLGYYIAEGYEGLVHHTRSELRVGMRYFFQPQMCMLQWRHSGLLNYVSRSGGHWQVRLEGLWIG